MSLLTAAVATAALVFTYMALSSCRYAIADNYVACSYDGKCEMGGVSDLGLGIINNDYNSSYCISYVLYDSPELGHYLRVEFDAAWKTARSCALVAVSIGSLGVICIRSCAMCCTLAMCLWKLLAVIYGVCALCTILTLTMFASENACGNGASCSFGLGAAYAVIAAVLWAVSAIGCKVQSRQPQPAPLTQPAGNLRVTVKETIEADGTKITEKITENPDGSKTVERTVTETAISSDSAAAPLAVAIPYPNNELKRTNVAES